MDRHTIKASAERFKLLSDQFSSEMRSSKREKFLFEDDSAIPALPAASMSLPNLRTLPDNLTKALPGTLPSDFVMRITIDTIYVTELRHLILSNCGDLILYMRVKPIDHASKMKVWLCLKKNSIDTLISHILQVLPQAEFGKITPLH